MSIDIGQAHLSEVGEKLPVFVEGPERLSPEALAEIKKMQGTDPIGYFRTAIIAWLSILASVLVAIYFNNPFIDALVIVFIATRQNVIGLLVHEQAHQHGIFAPWGDYVANLLCAYPLGVSVEGYRRIHLSHHKYFFDGAKDPDYIRKQGEEWKFPQKVSRFLQTVIRDGLGLHAIALYKSKQSVTLGKEFDRTDPRVNWTLRILFYLVAVSVLTYFKLWLLFLLFWVLPLFTVFQILVFWGAVCEHRYNLVSPSIPEATPMIEHAWWERILLPNLNFNYHVYHHWWPGISFTRLPKVASIFRREGLVHEEAVFRSYGAYLRFILK